MALTPTRYERKYIVDQAHSGETFYAALFTDPTTNAVTFTADAGTNTFTSSSHGFVNGVRVGLSNSGGALPDPLSGASTYYIVSAATNTFQLSASKGGSAIDITDTGSGTHTMTEKAFSDEDREVAIWARHESAYDGSSRRPFTVGAASESNPAVTAAASVTFDPATGITYRYFAVIRDGSSTSGDGTGTIVAFNDYVSTLTVPGSGQDFTYQVQF